MQDTDLVAIDLGGTHVRFARAAVAAGRVTLGPETVLRTNAHASLAAAWCAVEEAQGVRLPPSAAVAVAGPITGGRARMTNHPWVVDEAELRAALGLDRVVLLNDFAAVAHAVRACSAAQLRHLAGPDLPLPVEGVVSVIGPGTGLGVAMLDGARVIATEGGHIAFAPQDGVEQAVAAVLAEQHGRVSAERVVSGAGLRAFCAAIAPDHPVPGEDAALWSAALGRHDRVAALALSHFCAALGSVAGDLALAHGAHALVLAGGLGLRLADTLPGTAFAARFRAKGRFEAHMAALPVRIITHAQPGLLGAAAAFAHMERAPLQG